MGSFRQHASEIICTQGWGSDYAGEVWIMRVVIWTLQCILWWSNQGRCDMAMFVSHMEKWKKACIMFGNLGRCKRIWHNNIQSCRREWARFMRAEDGENVNMIMKLISIAKPVSLPGKTQLPGVKLASSNHSLEILTKNNNNGMNLWSILLFFQKK